MKKSALVLFTLLIAAATGFAGEGLLNVESMFSVDETANRMETILKEKGMTLFNRINHSASAGNVGIELRDTQIIIFGNPKAGSPLMKCQQTMGIDLPQKALIWKDANHTVWISYNDPGYLKDRHDLSGCDQAIAKIAKALANITKLAAGN
jgi:uncharacterized protein (DUF302 family)